VLALALPEERQIRFYGSSNLRDWEHLSDFGPLGADGGIWECPVLSHLPLNGDPDNRRWLLKVSINDVHPAGGSGDQYFVGDFDGCTFRVDDARDLPLWVDYGADHYSAMAWFDAPSDHGEQVWIAWLSNWRYARNVPTSPWRGAMTLPRTVELTSTPRGPRLIQQPVAALASLRGNGRVWGGSNLAALNACLAAVAPVTTCEVWVSIALGTATGIELRVGAVMVGYDRLTGELYVDRTQADAVPFHPAFPARHAAPLPNPDGTLDLRLFLDTSSVEVCTARGDVWLTDLVFPPPGAGGIEVVAAGGAPDHVRLEHWPLASIWPA
jgi:fructan beta-fructosidase